MLPVIALVGRPNVGKSTLFNVLTRSRDALVADRPGLTRDRKYGFGRLGPAPYIVVDTGGIGEEEDGIYGLMARQTRQALSESDLVLFLVDARAGLGPGDQVIAEELREAGHQVLLVVNKAEGQDPDMAASEFHALGLGDPFPISSAHKHRIESLMETAFERLPGGLDPDAGPVGGDRIADGVRVAVVGRPNVGKSTLINRLIGEERLLAFDQPGTTRDAVDVPFQVEGRDYVLVDTAGLRRRARVQDSVEKFSAIKTLQAIDGANVVIVVLDASGGITDQDAHLLGQVVDRGRALVLAVNKWDGLDPDLRHRVREELDRRLGFVDFAPAHLISALHGSGVGDLMSAVDDAYGSAVRDLATGPLNELLAEAVERHQPPLVHGRRIKLRYVHQGGRNPPVLIVHGNQTDALPDSYRRYLNNFFRQRLGLTGTPLRIEFRSGTNPFAGRRNILTPRQERKRRRMTKHHKQK